MHQCARFFSRPMCDCMKKQSRILLGTSGPQLRDRGLILWQNGTLALDAYCDSDFAGFWHRDYTHLHESVLSRTGYVIILGGALIHWVSKLQMEIALSMTEADYIALSACARELLPLHASNLIQDHQTWSCLSTDG